MHKIFRQRYNFFFKQRIYRPNLFFKQRYSFVNASVPVTLAEKDIDIDFDDALDEVTDEEEDMVTGIETDYSEDETAETTQLAVSAEESDGTKQPDTKEPPVEQQPAPAAAIESKAADLEQVMNNGMLFLAGLFKMSTGKDLGLEGQQIKVNKETGELTMTFKLPM